MFAQNAPKTVKINYADYEVLPYDLDGTYTWNEANEACDKLVAFGKSDWFLPDKFELDGLYRHRKEIGGFKNDVCYWSSSTEFFFWGVIQIFSETAGAKQCSIDKDCMGFDKYVEFRVRCVRKK